MCVLAMAPVDAADAQNLDAGKPASQIFAEVCANCHKSPREVGERDGLDHGCLSDRLGR